MRRLAILAVLGALVYLVSCSDDNNPVKSAGKPLFSVSLQDTNGDPVSGWIVGSINHPIDGGISADVKKPCPSTDITFSLPEPTDWTLIIYDYNGDQVISYFGVNDVGELSISWNGLDANQTMVPDGFYRYRLSAGDFKDERWMVLERFFSPPYGFLGMLDSNGYYSTNNIALFPGLIVRQPIEYYTDTVTIHFTGYDEVHEMAIYTFVVKLNRDDNEFSFLMSDSGIAMVGGER